MRRAPWVFVCVGVMALVVAAGVGGVAMLRAYLPAWLFFVSVPIGALPLLMGMELSGMAATPLAGALRRVLVVLPLAALLAVPLLLHVRALYGWSDGALPGFGGRWWQPGAFIVREAVCLAVWTLLGLVFMHAPPVPGAPWRRVLAVLGWVLHLVMGTVAAIDWAMSLQPGLHSSEFGLLAMVAQCGTALSAAILLAAASGDERAVLGAGPAMLVLLGAWLFLQFAQYLVVWSANLPGEIVWYQQRDTGLGAAAAWCALACVLIATPLLLRRRARVVAAAGAVLPLHLIEMLWTVTPAWRGAFTISAADLLLMTGVGGIVGGGVLVVARHGGPLVRS